MKALEAAARACAKIRGDDYDDLPATKREWNVRGGMFGGRFRSINEPFRSDYEEMATAAIVAFLAAEPSEAMIRAATMEIPTWDDDASRRKWRAMADAAINEITSKP